MRRLLNKAVRQARKAGETALVEYVEQAETMASGRLDSLFDMMGDLGLGPDDVLDYLDDLDRR